MKNENQEKTKTLQQRFREDIDARIASETEAELATLRKAESVFKRATELIAEEKGKVSNLRADGESTTCQLKTAPPDEIMPLSKKKVQIDRQIEEIEEGIKNLNNMLPAATEALEKAKMDLCVKILITTRKWRDEVASEFKALLETQVEPLLAAYLEIAEVIFSEYRLFSIYDRYEGGDIRKIQLTSPLLFDAVKDGDPSYKFWLSTRHPLQNLSPDQQRIATMRSSYGGDIVRK